MKTYHHKYLLLGMVLFSIAFIALFAFVKESVLAQNTPVSQTLTTQYQLDPVYQNLEEFSQLPIQENTIK